MSRTLWGMVGAAVVLACAAGARAEDYKGVVIKSVDTDLKAKPAEHVVTATVGKKVMKFRFHKEMKAYNLKGEEMAGNLSQVFGPGHVVDLKTEKDGDKVMITEAKLIKKK